MKLFLLESVAKVGKAGELVTVKDGYGRNFLIPRRLAVTATDGTEKQIEEQKKRLSVSLSRQEERAKELRDKIEALHLKIGVQAGKQGKIFGSVTNQAIQKQLKEQGITVDRRSILLENPIHELGQFNISIRLSSAVEAVLKLQIVKS